MTTTTNTLKQNRVNQRFIDSCRNSNLQEIKNLVNETIAEQKSTFYFFKQIFKKEDPVVDFFANKNEGLKVLSKNGEFDILNYLHSLPLFLDQLNDKNKHRIPDYFDCFEYAGANGHLKCAELFVPYIEKHNNYTLSVYHNFNDACRSGDLNVVKFLINTPLLKFNASDMINSRYGEFQTHAQPFISACEGGQLNVVQYFTSDKDLKEKINLEWINDTVCIDDQKIIEHFIFDLNLPGNHKFLSLIYNQNDNHDDIINKLLKIRNNFKDLSIELDNNPSIKKITKKI